MAKNRKSQFGPALKAAFFCLLITGSAVGYVWQKGKINQLGRQIEQCDLLLRQLKTNNQKLTEQYAELHEPIRLEQRAKELNLGLVPLQPEQVVRIVEPAVPPVEPKFVRRQWVARTDSVTP
jgi:cell division protein FtsL